MKLTQLFVALSIASIAVIGSGSRTHATTKTSDFNVTASVAANCSITSTSVSFGAYDPLATTDLTANGSVTVRCTKGAAVTVDLNGGGQATGAFNQMASATGGMLRYQLFRDESHSQRWNNSTNGGSSLSFTSTSMAPVVSTMYGVVEQGQDAPVATDYTDTVTATVNF